MAACLGASSESSCSFLSFLKGGSSNSNDPPFVTELTLTDTDNQATDTFEFGERVQMQLKVRNRLTTTAEAQFPTTRTTDFVVVRDNTSTVLWKWSNSQPVAAQTTTTLTWQPGETKTFPVTPPLQWDQKDDNGVQVTPGTYEARGVLVYDGFDTNPLQVNNMGSSPVQFTIRSP